MVRDWAAEQILRAVTRFLGVEDDRALWARVVEVIAGDVAFMLSEFHPAGSVLLHIGRCSRWLRPHQTRWTAAGGFAWPTGYGDGHGGYSRQGLPQLDVSVLLQAELDAGAWRTVRGRPGRRPLVLRVAVPSRTSRHRSAAVHTVWLPGSPGRPDEKRVRFLGFRRQTDGWQLVADGAPLWQPQH